MHVLIDIVDPLPTIEVDISDQPLRRMSPRVGTIGGNRRVTPLLMIDGVGMAPPLGEVEIGQVTRGEMKGESR